MIDDGRLWTLVGLAAVTAAGIGVSRVRGSVVRLGPLLPAKPARPKRYVPERAVTVDLENGAVGIQVMSSDSFERLALFRDSGDLLYTSVGDSSAIWCLGEVGGCQSIEEAQREHALWANDYENDAGWTDVDASAVVAVYE